MYAERCHTWSVKYFNMNLPPAVKFSRAAPCTHLSWRKMLLFFLASPQELLAATTLHTAQPHQEWIINHGERNRAARTGHGCIRFAFRIRRI